MKLFQVMACLVSLIFGAGPVVADEPKSTERPKLDPLGLYATFERQGFTIKVSPRVLRAGEAVRVLESHLVRTVNMVSDGHRAFLRGVPIWIEQDDTVRQYAGFGPAASDYVPLDSPQLKGWVIPSKLGGVQIYADPVLLDPQYARNNPGFVLHELAHAAHDRLLGYDNMEVKKAFEQAGERKLYENVALFKHWWWHPRSRAYAASNEVEYFAELSVAYFDSSVMYFPFSRDDLQKHDPVGFALMKSFWNTSSLTLANCFPNPISLSWVGPNGRRHMLFDLMPGQKRQFDSWSLMNLVGEDMFTGKEYRFERPKAGEANWRLTAENTVKK